MNRFATALLAAVAAGAASFAWQAAAQAPFAIESAPLSQLDGWSVGATSRAQGAFPTNLWANSDGAVVAQLFDRLPATFASPAAHWIARRTLTSAGTAPQGEAAPDAMRKRFSALGRMGLADDLAMMAAGAGTSAADPAIAQYAAQAELARARRSDACLRGRQALVEEPPAFLLRLRAYCAAAIGERAGADLALELARQARAEDAWFRAAISGIGEGAPRARVAARYDSSLNTSVSLAADLRPAANPLANASALSLLTLARTESTPYPLRTQAAAAAYLRGALPATEARTIFLATPAEITTALPDIVVAMRRAAAAPEAAGAAIAVRLARATTPVDFTAAANLFRTDIANLTSAPDAAAALNYARAALIAGDVTLAERLIANASGAGANPINVARLAAAIAVAKNDAQGAASAASQRIGAGGAAGSRAAARDAAILAALGAPLDPQARGFLAANPALGGRPADATTLAALTAAVQASAIGETALLAALAAAPGAQTLDAASLTALIESLRRVGLEEAARRIAIEALVT